MDTSATRQMEPGNNLALMNLIIKAGNLCRGNQAPIDMQQVWANSDLIPYVCPYITDVHHLAALSAVNKAINDYLFSTTGGKHWIRAGKLVCGEEYWPQDEISLHLEQTDPRYLTKIRICPWISEPEEVGDDERLRIRVRTAFKSEDELVLDKLNKLWWAPSHGESYGSMDDIIKLHNGVSIVKSDPAFAQGEHVFAYFIATKDSRLLRDRFYLVKQAYWENWAASINGNLYMLLRESEENRALKTLRFGIRADKATTPFPPARTRACGSWTASRTS